MFGKKKQALPPFALQVLTPEYLIEGTVEGGTSLYFAGYITEVPPFHLTSVKIQATGPVNIPTQMCPQFAVLGTNAVALIPWMDVTQMSEYDHWRAFTKPLLGVFQVGPYVIQGRLMLMSEDHFEKQMPMFDVHITSQFPNAHLGVLHAPFAVVNFHWLYGYECR